MHKLPSEGQLGPDPTPEARTSPHDPPATFSKTNNIIGVILGLYWGYIGVIWGLYWGYIGVILGLYGGYMGIILGLD